MGGGHNQNRLFSSSKKEKKMQNVLKQKYMQKYFVKFFKGIRKKNIKNLPDIFINYFLKFKYFSFRTKVFNKKRTF